MRNSRNIDIENDPEFRCFNCLHVRVGTLMLGICQVVSQMAILFILITLILQSPNLSDMRKQYNFDEALSIISLNDHHKKMSEVYSNSDKIVDNSNKEAVVIGGSSKLDLVGSNSGKIHSKGGKPCFNYCPKKAQMLMAVMYTSGSFFIAYLLVNGVIYKKATYILPFFALQVLDFVVTCLNIMGHITKDPFTYKKGMAPIATESTRSSVYYGDINDMFKAFFVLALKAYLLGMVWSCYKYFLLYQHQQMGHSLLAAGCPFSSSSHGATENAEAANITPPKYEEVMNSAAGATSNNPPPYTDPATATTENTMAS